MAGISNELSELNEDLIDRCDRFLFTEHAEITGKITKYDAESITNTLGEEVSQIESVVSQKDLETALRSIQSLFEWFRLYRESIEDRHDKLLTQHATDETSKYHIKFIKNVTDNCRTHFERNFEKQEIKKNDLSIELHSCWEKCEKIAKRLSKKMKNRITNSPYPLLCLYTSQDGMLSWFGRRIPISYNTLEMKREMQFKEIHSLTDLQQIQRDHWIKQVNDVIEERKMILMIYQSLSVHLTTLMKSEYQLLDLENENLRFKEGFLYRGEKMTQKELNVFRQKYQQSHESMQYFKTFCEGFCSTTTDKSIALGFLSSKNDDLAKVLHIIHVVNPNCIEMETFQSLFPDHHVKCDAMDISKYSEFQHEKEIIIVDLPVIGLDMCCREDGVWQIEYVASTFDIEMKRNITEAKLVNDELGAAMDKYTSNEDPEQIINFYREHLDDLAINYFSLLTMLASYRYVRRYYEHDTIKRQYFDDMLSYSDSHLKLLILICDIIRA